MGDTTDKIIDYYERVRTDDPNAPAFPFSREYDDVPWDAKVQMLRYSYHHQQAKDDRIRGGRPIEARASDDDDLPPVDVFLLALFFLGFGGISFMFVFTLLAESIATLAGVDGVSGDTWERLWLGVVPIFVLVALVGTIGIAIRGNTGDSAA